MEKSFEPNERKPPRREASVAMSHGRIVEVAGIEPA